MSTIGWAHGLILLKIESTRIY